MPGEREAEIADLIARLEAATEGSRQLDGDIAEALSLCPPGSKRTTQGSAHHRAAFATSPAHVWIASRYTESLDAAMTLVPDRHRWLLDKRPGAKDRFDGYRAEVYREAHPYASNRSDVPTHWGPTPALALCVAALKARATVTPSPQEPTGG